MDSLWEVLRNSRELLEYPYRSVRELHSLLWVSSLVKLDLADEPTAATTGINSFPGLKLPDHKLRDIFMSNVCHRTCEDISLVSFTLSRYAKSSIQEIRMIGVFTKYYRVRLDADLML